MIDQVIKFFIVFFVVVEPLSIAPVFVSLTSGATPEFQRRMAFKAVSIAGLILLIFSLIGTPFLAAMGISIQAFRIFGGLLLFLIALEMVFARESGTRTSNDEKAENAHRPHRDHTVTCFRTDLDTFVTPTRLQCLLITHSPQRG